MIFKLALRYLIWYSLYIKNFFKGRETAMFQHLSSEKNKMFSRIFNGFLSVVILSYFILPPGLSYAQVVSFPMMNLPAAGTMVNVSEKYTPLILQGIVLDPENPLKLKFIVDTGDSGLEGESLNKEALKVIKYFFAALTVPQDDMWVNLSPYEGDKMIPEVFGQTEMGRDMLAQDYILKQLTASLMFPDEKTGKEFWTRVYARAKDLYGTTQLPFNTFNKIWITPKTATIYENAQGALATDERMEVMLERDYMSLAENADNPKFGMSGASVSDLNETEELTQAMVREVLIPEVEREVNEGKHFANLRQIYSALVLASWFKQALKDSLLDKVYVDKNKIAGVNLEDKTENEKIYQQYLAAFEKGVYDLIKEENDPATNKKIQRKYYSGGFANKTIVGNQGIADVRPLPSSGSSPVTSQGTQLAIEIQGVEMGPRADDSKFNASIQGSPNVSSSPVELNQDKTVLVVDDSPAIRVLRKKQLEKEGYQVLLAGSVEEALRIIKESSKIDVGIFDYQLENGETGIDLARQINGAFRVILSSGDNQIDVDPNLIAAVVPKGSDPAELMQMVRVLASVSSPVEDLNSKDKSVRLEAIEKLSIFENEPAIGPLSERLGSETDPEVRAAILRAMDVIEGIPSRSASSPISGELRRELTDVIRPILQNTILPNIVDLEQRIQEYFSAKNVNEKAVAEKAIGNIVDDLNKFDRVSVESLSLARDINKLEDFMRSPRYSSYLNKAKETILSGRYTGRFIFAGAATRFGGPLYFVDLWKVAEREGKVDESQGQFFLGMGPRQIIAFRMAIEKLARSENQDVAEVLARQRLIVHTNQEVHDQILEDFKNNNFYGFNPENIFFIMQPALPGFRLENGQLVLDESVKYMPYGHGYNLMQLGQKGVAVQIDRQGQVTNFPQDVLSQFSDDTILVSHRINDSTKFMTSEVIGVEKLAYRLFLHEQGNNFVGELVGNPGKQKGGSVLQYLHNGRAKKFLIETLNAKGLPALNSLVEQAGNEGAPYNAFRVSNMAGQLKAIFGKIALPYSLRVKDGYVYSELVTGDMSQIEEVDAEFFLKQDELIHDFKELKHLDDALDFVRAQDRELLEAEASSSPVDVFVDVKDILVGIMRKSIYQNVVFKEERVNQISQEFALINSLEGIKDILKKLLDEIQRYREVLARAGNDNLAQVDRDIATINSLLNPEARFLGPDIVKSLHDRYSLYGQSTHNLIDGLAYALNVINDPNRGYAFMFRLRTNANTLTLEILEEVEKALRNPSGKLAKTSSPIVTFEQLADQKLVVDERGMPVNNGAMYSTIDRTAIRQAAEVLDKNNVYQQSDTELEQLARELEQVAKDFSRGFTDNKNIVVGELLRDFNRTFGTGTQLTSTALKDASQFIGEFIRERNVGVSSSPIDDPQGNIEPFQPLEVVRTLTPDEVLKLAPQEEVREAYTGPVAILPGGAEKEAKIILISVGDLAKSSYEAKENIFKAGKAEFYLIDSKGEILPVRNTTVVLGQVSPSMPKENRAHPFDWSSRNIRSPHVSIKVEGNMINVKNMTNRDLYGKGVDVSLVSASSPLANIRKLDAAEENALLRKYDFQNIQVTIVAAVNENGKVIQYQNGLSRRKIKELVRSGELVAVRWGEDQIMRKDVYEKLMRIQSDSSFQPAPAYSELTEQGLSSSPLKPGAAPDQKGGIDFNPEYLDLQIKRDGNGVPLPIERQPVQWIERQIQGIVPVIINVAPVTNLPMLLGVSSSAQEDNSLTKIYPQSPGRDPQELELAAFIE
jgi:CheY-like chemotaxis protein